MFCAVLKQYFRHEIQISKYFIVPVKLSNKMINRAGNQRMANSTYMGAGTPEIYHVAASGPVGGWC